MKTKTTLFVKLQNGDIWRKSFDNVVNCIAKATAIVRSGRIGILRRKVDSIWATYDDTKAIAINIIEI